MSVYKYSNFYVQRPTMANQSEANSYPSKIAESDHCNIARQKIKSVLKKTHEKSKHMFQTALKQSHSNIPHANIDLARQDKRSTSIVSLQKCRYELSLQKQILLKELESKQEKVQALRQTFRNIQSTKPKIVLKRDNKVAENRCSIDLQCLNMGGHQNRLTMREREDFHQSIGSPNLAVDLTQRTRLFPSNLRQL